MRPEDKEDDYIEDKENEEIEDINSDTQDNETTEEEANTHSDYQVLPLLKTVNPSLESGLTSTMPVFA